MRYRIKDNSKRSHDSYILEQYITEYSIASLSRYKHSNTFLLADGKTIKGNLNPWDRAIALANTSEFIVTVGEEDRIDIVATKVYGNASLYWVLCYANSISDPLKLPVGKYLLIPALEDLFEYPNPLA